MDRNCQHHESTSPDLVLQAHASMPGFLYLYHEFWGSNWSPHFCKAGTLPTEVPESATTGLELDSADPSKALVCTAGGHLETILPGRDVEGRRSWFSA